MDACLISAFFLVFHGPSVYEGWGSMFFAFFPLEIPLGFGVLLWVKRSRLGASGLMVHGGGIALLCWSRSFVWYRKIGLALPVGSRSRTSPALS